LQRSKGPERADAEPDLHDRKFTLSNPLGLLAKTMMIRMIPKELNRRFSQQNHKNEGKKIKC
jgi:hypothetical protein